MAADDLYLSRIAGSGSGMICVPAIVHHHSGRRSLNRAGAHTLHETPGWESRKIRKVCEVWATTMGSAGVGQALSLTEFRGVRLRA